MAAINKLVFNVGDKVLIQERVCPQRYTISYIMKITNTGNYVVKDGRVFSKYGEHRNSSKITGEALLMTFNQSLLEAQEKQYYIKSIREALWNMDWKLLTFEELKDLEPIIKKYNKSNIDA
jgi:hypothetical protein